MHKSDQRVTNQPVASMIGGCGHSGHGCNLRHPGRHAEWLRAVRQAASEMGTHAGGPCTVAWAVVGDVEGEPRVIELAQRRGALLLLSSTG